MSVGIYAVVSGHSVMLSQVYGHTRHRKERSRSEGERGIIQVRPGSGIVRSESEAYSFRSAFWVAIRFEGPYLPSQSVIRI